MKTKTMLLAVSALAALAFAALPALAAADEVDWTNPHFTVTGGKTNLAVPEQETEIICDEVTGTGEFTSPSKTTGHITLTFHGCEISPEEFECHSAGEPEGTITTWHLEFHIVQLTNDSNEDTAGILITPDPSEGTFASFSCVFELVPIHVLGNGVIGDITDPGYDDPSSTFTMDFGVDGEGEQEFTTVHGDETETEYELEAEIGGEGPYPATQEGEGTIHFTEEANAKITTTPETE